MKEFCIKAYADLQKEIEPYHEEKFLTLNQIESCFIISYTHWLSVAKKITTYPFTSIHEEILFFKHFKPLFISTIEYYNLLYHAELFKPDHCPKKLKAFYIKEKDRLQKFITTETSFYKYYIKGENHLDALYFTKCSLENLETASKYISHSCHLFSSHDHIVSQYMALKKYTVYIEMILSIGI